MLVRSAVPQDAGAIAACHVACWREAYAHLLSAEYLAALDPEDFRVRWTGALADPSRPSWVAEADGRVGGFSGTCPSRDQPPVRQLELSCLYVLREHQGTGVAQQLLDRALGDLAASLWVAEENPRARAFYARNGFRPDGSRASLQQMEGLTEIRLVR